MMSASPEASAATRAADSGIGLKMTRLTSIGPPQYSSKRSSVRWSSLTHSTNLTGPLPTGFWLKTSGPTDSKYFFGRIWPP